MISCKNERTNEFEKISDYFKQKHNFILNGGVNKIVVIGEGGGCPSCEKSFADFAFENLLDSSVFLVISRGNNINIKKFLDLEQNCFFDWQLDKQKFPEFKSSRIIYLKSNAIDTVVVINSKEFLEQISYFRNRTF